LLDQPRYGISHDDPSITAPEKCRYDACVEAPATFVAAGASLMTTIPGGKYAAHFKGISIALGRDPEQLEAEVLRMAARVALVPPDIQQINKRAVHRQGFSVHGDVFEQRRREADLTSLWIERPRERDRNRSGFPLVDALEVGDRTDHLQHAHLSVALNVLAHRLFSLLTTL